jgi:hypothetical protein
MVILNWQRPLWEGDWEVVKMSARDEPVWVVIHMCMEAILAITLCSYLYLKLAKMLCLSYYLLCFLLNKIEYKRAEQVLPGRGWKVAQTMYTHKNKCKNDKINKTLKNCLTNKNKKCTYLLGTLQYFNTYLGF